MKHLEKEKKNTCGNNKILYPKGLLKILYNKVKDSVYSEKSSIRIFKTG